MGKTSLADGGASEQQTRYWNEMVQLKAHIFYLSYICRSSDRIDFWLNCTTAVTSSSSIAGWAIWQSWSFGWACIIAASQVINAIKHYLPYSSRKTATNNTCRDMEALFIKAESDWYYVAEGELTDMEIHKKTIALKKAKAEISKKHMPHLILPRNRSYEYQAAEDATDYFETMYFMENSDG